MNRTLTTMVLLLVATAATAQVTTSTRFGFRSVNDPAYGATCGTETTGTTGSDHAAFQGAINDVSTAGGGTVYVPACVPGSHYYFSTGLEVKSNVNLVCQKGAVLKPRGDAVIAYPSGKGNAFAFLGFYGVTNAGIEGCTYDSTGVSTPANQANPIVVAITTPGSGTAGTGTRSSNITIKDVTVSTNNHASGPYLFWVREADQVKILNSTWDGNQLTYTASSDQNGIEIIAGTDILVSGNTVRNVGKFGLIVAGYGTGNYVGYESKNVAFVDNTVIGAAWGVGVWPSVDANGNVAFMQNITVRGNRIIDPWLVGIRVIMGTQPASPTAMYRNVVISDNVVDMTELSQGAYGIELHYGGVNTTADGMIVANNAFRGGRGLSLAIGTGMRMVDVKNAQFIGNSWTGGDVAMADPAVAAQAFPIVSMTGTASADVTFTGNYFGRAAGSAVWKSTTVADNYVWIGNTFDDWQATTSAQPPAINMAGGTANRWIVVGNKFIRGAGAEGYLLQGTIANNIGWQWRNNLYGGTTGFNRQADGLWNGACTTTGTEVNANSHGCAQINTGGAGPLTVTNAQIRAQSRIAVTQTGGDPVAFRATPQNGSFALTLASNCATANCTFYYEILN